MLYKGIEYFTAETQRTQRRKFTTETQRTQRREIMKNEDKDPERKTGLNSEITRQIIGAAIEIHKQLGPGLLESSYEECLCHELKLREIYFERQKPLPLKYKGILLDCGYRIDLVIDRKVIAELKSVERFEPVYEAQILTYMKLSGINTGLLINFNVPVLKMGIKRFVL
jgi:GxxExxY protein